MAYDYYHAYAAPAPPSGPTQNTYRSELHYLDLPVLLTVGPGSGSRKGWYVAAGPQLSLALDKHETVVPNGVSDADSYEENLNGDTKALQRLGAGYVVGIGRQWTGYGIELRYSGDITNVYRDGYGSGALYPGSSNRFHNGVIQVQVNLALRGGKWRWDWGKGGGYPYPHDGPVTMPEPRQRPACSPSRNLNLSSVSHKLWRCRLSEEALNLSACPAVLLPFRYLAASLAVYAGRFFTNIFLSVMAHKAIEITDANFEEIINSDKPVLVDFWAEWCGPCRMVGPVVEELAGEYEGKAIVGKVDVDANPQTSMKFGIRSIPTLLVFKNGQIVDKQVGAVPKHVLAQKLEAQVTA